MPIVTDTSPVVDGLEESPRLLGFVATTEKDTSRTLLRIGPEQDPLLSTWQVGLGRATSWMSDANPQWSQLWVDWDGYAGFWSTLVRDTFPVETTGSVRTIVDGDTLRIRAEADPGSSRVVATVSAPNGATSDVRLREVAPGIFEGDSSADAAGTYAVAVNGSGDAAESAIGASLASVSYSAEYRPGTSDEAALRRISEASGGRGAITAAQAWDEDGLLSGRRTIPLATWLLTLAAVAWLLAAVFSRLWLSGSRQVLGQAEATATAQSSTSARPEAGARTASSSGGTPPDQAASESTEAEPPPAPSAPEPPASAATVNELLKARREKRGK